jgi:hypothetical protein
LADCGLALRGQQRAAADDTQALGWKWPPGVCAEIRAGPRRSLVSRPRVHQNDQMHRKAPYGIPDTQSDYINPPPSHLTTLTTTRCPRHVFAYLSTSLICTLINPPPQYMTARHMILPRHQWDTQPPDAPQITPSFARKDTNCTPRGLGRPRQNACEMSSGRAVPPPTAPPTPKLLLSAP